MKKEIQIFFSAVMFFTRIPVPTIKNFSSEQLQKSARYFSWVGLLVGIIGASVFYISQKYFSAYLAIAFSMLATILTTGAFHEDGFADCCDAFGGGWNKEKILTIMKDSRLGTYGVIGLIGILGFKFLLLHELLLFVSVKQMLLVMIAAHSCSRLMPVIVMQLLVYVQDIDVSKSKPLANRKLTILEMIIAIIGGLICFLFLPLYFLFILIPILLSTFLMANYFKKWIGGYTGDCLGTTQQISELIFYFGVILISILVKNIV